MKIVVIGTGAAAYGALAGLLEFSGSRKPEITLVGPESEADFPDLSTRDPRDWSHSETAQLHRRIRRSTRSTILPPRTLFGTPLQSWEEAGAPSLLASPDFGGLGNFWSCGVFPFRDRDFDDWSIGRRDLERYYHLVARKIGYSAQQDGLSAVYCDSDFMNRPGIVATDLAERLINTIGQGCETDQHIVSAGRNRLATDTMPGSDRNCVGCGGCMYGCFRGALFTAGPALKRVIKSAGISICPRKAISLLPSKNRPAVKLDDGSVVEGDKIILCAGAIGSSEILLRTIGDRNSAVYLDDNENYLFPIAVSRSSTPDSDKHFAFGEATIWFEPKFGYGSAAQASVAPVFNYLLDFYAPAIALNSVRRAASYLRRRVLLARLHFGSATATRYELGLSRNGKLAIRNIRRGASDFRARAALRSLKSVLAATEFFLPFFPLIRASTSAHYCGGFGAQFRNAGQSMFEPVLPGVWLGDACAFPNLPAQAPTFTIMAFAAGVAHMSMIKR